MWFTVQTILLIGVGDAEPHNQYFFLYFGVPITVIGDIISSHIIYYLHVSNSILTNVIYLHYGNSRVATVSARTWCLGVFAAAQNRIRIFRKSS